LAEQRPVIRLEDEEGGSLHATWSRSGKRLIVTLTRGDAYAQVELRPEQVEKLTMVCAHPCPGALALDVEPLISHGGEVDRAAGGLKRDSPLRPLFAVSRGHVRARCARRG
jgi:hypothetical protein